MAGKGFDNQDSIPRRGKNSSLHHCVKIGSGTYPAPYPIYIWGRGTFPEGEVAEVANAWSCNCTPPHAFTVLYIISTGKALPSFQYEK
jgi:hypothetical protein